jgi:hypothetical protein
MSGALPWLPDDLLHQTALIKNKAADSYHESAATSIATTGQPPASHERTVVSITRRRSLGAPRRPDGGYQMIRQRGAARSVRGARCERDARLRHAEGAGVPLMLCSTGCKKWHPPPARVVNRSDSAKTSGSRHRKRGRAVAQWTAPRCVRSSGTQVVSRLDAYASTDHRPVRPDSWDFGPSAWLRKELHLMAISHQREATWRNSTAPPRRDPSRPTRWTEFEGASTMTPSSA